MEQHSKEMIISLMREAAGNLRQLMPTDMSEEIKLREFLPDELEGSAYMLEDEIKLELCPPDIDMVILGNKTATELLCLKQMVAEALSKKEVTP